MLDDLKNLFRKANIINKLLYINIGVFVPLTILSVLAKWSQLNWAYANYGNGSQIFGAYYWLSAETSWSNMLLKPWTIVTYAFVHQGLWHLVFNLLVFYYVGNIFAGMLGEKRVVPLYILGAIAGFFAFAFAYNLFPYLQSPSGSIIMGASASVMAIMVAAAIYFPDYKIRLILFGEVPLKIIAIIYIVLDLAQLQGNANIGGHIAHLGGALFGFIYAVQLKKGNDIGLKVSDFIKSIFKPKSKLKVSHKQAKTAKSKQENSGDTQRRTDAILDKISKGGYDNLSKEEKDFLFKASNND